MANFAGSPKTHAIVEGFATKTSVLQKSVSRRCCLGGAFGGLGRPKQTLQKVGAFEKSEQKLGIQSKAALRRAGCRKVVRASRCWGWMKTPGGFKNFQKV